MPENVCCPCLACLKCGDSDDHRHLVCSKNNELSIIDNEKAKDICLNPSQFPKCKEVKNGKSS